MNRAAWEAIDTGSPRQRQSELRPLHLPTDGEELARLVRLLIIRAGRVTTGCTDAKENAVILDIEVEGVRCLLISVRTDAPAGLRADSSLSPREQEIAHMVGSGYPDKTIAAILGISRQTVATHLRRIFLKLGVHTRAAMVARVVENELTI